MVNKGHRWVVNVVASGFIVAALAALSALMFGGSSRPIARADEPFAEPAATSVPQSPVEFLPLPSGSEKKIADALKQPTHLDFQDSPLQDVVDYLRDLHGIEIQLDEKALTDASIDLETQITKSLKGISFRSALRLVLGALDLTAIVQDDVLLITTQEVAANSLTTRTYPVGDLASEKTEYGNLVEAITTTIRPDSWDENGGPGNLSIVPSVKSIVISQPSDVHDEVLELLRSLRAARKAQTK
jgi:hypothetical protein